MIDQLCVQFVLYVIWNFLEQILVIGGACRCQNARFVAIHDISAVRVVLAKNISQNAAIRLENGLGRACVPFLTAGGGEDIAVSLSLQ